jgi:hypothetical protein
MDSNLPATTGDGSTAIVEATGAIAEERATPPRRQRLSVAFLPLALVTFVILALAIAAWTFLAAAT